MDHQHFYQADNALHNSQTPTSSMPSPSISTWSRGHSSKSSASTNSIASSPIPPRESFDLYGSTKLEDVREEPHEREDGQDAVEQDTFGHAGERDSIAYYSLHGSSPPGSPIQPEYSLGDQDAWSTTSSGHHPFKRQRSVSNKRNSVTDMFSSRFGSISRRWKTRSGIGPQLSIITHTAPIARGRSSSAESSQIFSPALSAISKHESYLPPSPIRSILDETSRESVVVPIYIDNAAPRAEEELDPGQATTPLLPPIMTDLRPTRDSPIQSPLQSPSIAPTGFANSRGSMEFSPYSNLPSPPLSTRPSMASIQRSRANTANTSAIHEIPPLHLCEDPSDLWAHRLGHADFSIHPEPYMPDHVDVDQYKQFRSNWEQARKQYAQHLARTIEHYGETSKVCKLTREKWNWIDDLWKKNECVLSATISPTLTRLGECETPAPDSPSSSMLEKPVTRIIVPPMDNSGKFPEMGDADIVGPLSIGPAKVAELERGQSTPPQSPTKRTLFKFLSEVLGRHSHQR